MWNALENSRHHSKGITQTVYTVLIALIAMAVLTLILVLFIQKFFDFQLTTQTTEQSRGAINLAQALMSSDKLAYVDSNSVVHRGVIDADKTRKVNMDNLRKEFSYPGFYYTLTISNFDNNDQIIKPGVTESIFLSVNYAVNKETRTYPVAIRYADGVIDAGIMSIKSGWTSQIAQTSATGGTTTN